MSHKLDTRNGAAGMIYRGETPWHGLGKKVTHEIKTTDEAVDLCDMNFPIELQQLIIEKDSRKVKRFAVVRLDTGDVFGTVGPGWHIHRQKDFFKALQPMVDGGFGTIETAGVVRKGARIWMMLKINRPDCVIVPGVSDTVEKNILLAQGYDGKLGIHFGCTPIRTVCDNTLTAAIHGGTSALLRFSHTKFAMKGVDAAREIMMEADTKFEEVAKVYRALAAKSATVEQVRAYVKKVFHPEKRRNSVDAQALMASIACDRQAAEIVDEALEKENQRKQRIMESVVELFETSKTIQMPGVANTGWGAYNSVTEYLTWERGRSTDTRIDNLWFEDQATSVRALEAAVDTFLT
jgi:phage/plasmid-like protein (TIGR03299 family)